MDYANRTKLHLEHGNLEIFTDAVIFYLNIGDLGLHFCAYNYVFVLYIYYGFFAHISSPLSLCKRFQYLLCFAITIVTLQNLHLDLYSLSLSSLLNPNFYKKRLKSVAKTTPNTKVIWL
ncbi:hypothetical protein AMTRI_Chr02g260990 [Amborella trichopoda]